PGVSPTKSMLAIPGAEEALQKVMAQTPMGRLVTPEEVADVVSFLVSGKADMMAGQQLVVDGGAILV
ncbi:SDR family oxidoreductase, partial [bacterium]|nr:SDR family oxidoreductase [bacterium]